MKNMAVDPDVNVEEIAKLVHKLYLLYLSYMAYLFVQTEGCSGAELTALCRDAALMTMSENMDARFVRVLILTHSLSVYPNVGFRFRMPTS